MAPSSSSSEVLLDRFTVRPGHLDRWEALRAADEAVLAAHGLRVLRTFVETDAEPKVTAMKLAAVAAYNERIKDLVLLAYAPRQLEDLGLTRYLVA